MRIIIFLLLSFMSLHSACVTYSTPQTSVNMQGQSCNNHPDAWCGRSCTSSCSDLSSKCSGDILQRNNKLYLNASIYGQMLGCDYNPGHGSNCNFPSAECYYYTVCDLADLDSIKCARDPLGPNCQNQCTEFRDECEEHGGTFAGNLIDDKCSATCNLCGSPAEQFAKDRLYDKCCSAGLSVNYFCGFTGFPQPGKMAWGEPNNLSECTMVNWENQKVCEDYLTSSSSSDQSSSSSSSDQSSSSQSEYCKIFPDDLACICIDDPTNPECDIFNSSSSEGGEGTSSEGGESSSSEGGEGTSSGSGSGVGGVPDWEYDYRDSLHRIINATSKTASNTAKTASNTGLIDGTLKSILGVLNGAKCLFMDCTNYDSLLSTLGDDSNPVIPDGDTAGIINAMKGELDSIKLLYDSSLVGEKGDEGYGINADSLNSIYDSIGSVLAGIVDSGAIKDFGDTFSNMILTNFPSGAWGYTQSCPSMLNKHFTFHVGGVSHTTEGTIGDFLCGNLPIGGISLLTLARNLFRLILTVSMAFMLYRFCMSGGKSL